MVVDVENIQSQPINTGLPTIKVVGVGGGGGNVVNRMVNDEVKGVQYISANTDVMVLNSSKADITIPLGSKNTKGLGAGMKPEVGKLAAEEDVDTIKSILENTDLIFIAAGMGGGTGTGAAPVIAEIAQEMSVLTVAVVTKPFPWEGNRRMDSADQGIEELKQYVDSLITIPNEKLQAVLGKGTTLLDAFKEANNVLLNAVQGISELITRRGLINVDFADVKAVMSNMGTAMMGTGSSVGEERAREAAERAISSPLLDDVSMAGAKGILVNITAGMDLSIGEFEEVGLAVKEFASENATVVVGTVIEPEMTGEMRVTIVATGIGHADANENITLAATNESFSASGINENDLSEYEQLKIPSKIVVGHDVTHQDTTDLTYLDIPAFLRRQND